MARADEISLLKTSRVFFTYKNVASRNRTGVSSETVAVGYAKSTTIRTDHYTIATHPGKSVLLESL